MVSAVIFVATSCVSPLTGFAFWETNLAYEGESIYNYLQVKNLSDRTILSTNVLFGVLWVPLLQLLGRSLAHWSRTPRRLRALAELATGGQLPAAQRELRRWLD